MSERKFWWEGIVLAALLGLVGIYLYGAGERPLEPSAVSAASELWRDIEAGELPHTTAAVRRIHPPNARLSALDTAAMHRILDQAPAEDARMGVLLSLPLPDGRSATFRVRQVPVMAPELAAEFPSFGTYAAVGVDDPAAVGRLDWTAHGFHAMITAPGGTVYIDPVAAGDVTHYQSYLRRDFFRTADPQSIPPDEVVADDKLRAELAALTAAYVRTRAARPTGEELRTYRLAVAATGEYTQFHGGTVADGLAAIVTAINRVNGIYERDAAVRMVLVGNNDQIIYTNGSTDPYTNNSGGTMLGQNQANLDSVIGSANYDIGHVFSTGGGGIAGLAVTCENGRKGYGVTGLPSPIGDPFYVDYVSHEIGHQFGGTHTMNGNEGACGGSRTGTTAYEPGSGATIMAYAGICGSQNLQNNSDDHFHAASVDQMVAFTTQGGGNSCAQIINTGNTPPTADAGENFTIPADTPFMLSGTGDDAEASAGLTYNWEELDLGPAGPPDVSTSPPYFRSWPSQTDGTRVFPRLTDLINNTTAVGEVLPTASDELVFRLTVRDNQADGGGVTGDEMAVTVTDAAGPFRVQAPNTAVSWTVGGVQTVNWAVAATTGAPINCTAVDIDLSADGGLTYPFNLVSAVANDGSHPVLVPNAETTAARVRVSCADNIFFDISDVDFTIAAPTESTFSLTVDPSNRQVCRPQPAVYTVQTEPLLGFNEPIDLSVTGIPAGATADFEPLTVTPGVSSTLTVSDTGAALTGDYGLTITAGAATVTRTAGVSLTLLPETIAPATLSSPADGATGLDPTVAFSWTAVAEADTYLFELSTGAAFDMADVVYTQMTAGTGVTVPQTAVDYGTRYYWRVTAETPCGPAVADASTFTTRSAPGACGPGYEPVIGFATDFESGAVGWATSGTQNTWTLTADGGVDGSAGWYGQDVGSPSDQRLVSPPVTIPTGLTPTLQFMNAQAFEAPDQDGRCWDGAILEVSTDDGGTWDYLSNTVMYADADPYDNIFRTTANPIADDGAGGFREGWCDAAQPYTNAVVDVSAYVSETVRFRWRLGTDSSIGAEGWYVDEVQVQACRINMAAIEMSASPMQTAARGTTVTHTIHITNTAAVSDSYGLTTAGSAWATVLGAPTVSLAAGEAVTVPVMVSVPMTAAIGQTDAAMVTAVSGNDGSVSAQAAVATTAIDPVGLQVVVAPPTQTVTATHTVTLTGLITNVTGLTQTVDVTVGGPYTATVTPISATVSAGETVSVSVGVLVPPMPLDAAAVAVTAAPRDARFSSVTGTAVLVYAPPPPAVYRLYLPFVVGR